MINSESTSRADPIGWRLERTYATLPAALFARVTPATWREPRLITINRPLASELGLDIDAVNEADLVHAFSGQALPAGAEPIAQAYAGHQYGHLTMLGDGRALLLGEQRTPTGALMDIQLKGSGRTPFSRSGDGLAALGPMLREHIIGEAMHALGVPTTRSLAVLTTGEPVHRDGVKRGAILVRVASSHLRVGTFQFASAWDAHEGGSDSHASLLRALVDYAIARHMPDMPDASDSIAAQARHLLRTLVERQASLIARWQMIGFVHGVMNTDNMAISGETIDYGPCAFMDAYDPATVFSSIDRGGRYAYGEQPRVAAWNLARFAEALLPLLDDDQERGVAIATTALEEFPRAFERAWLEGMRAKLGLRELHGAEADDPILVRDLLDWMHAEERDFTNTFRALSAPMADDSIATAGPVFVAWHDRWCKRLARQGDSSQSVHERMRRENPAVIPRNHRVEAVLAAAEREDDLGPLHELLRVLASPFELAEADSHFAEPPPPTFRDYTTFCGT